MNHSGRTRTTQSRNMCFSRGNSNLTALPVLESVGMYRGQRSICRGWHVPNNPLGFPVFPVSTPFFFFTSFSHFRCSFYPICLPWLLSVIFVLISLSTLCCFHSDLQNTPLSTNKYEIMMKWSFLLSNLILHLKLIPLYTRPHQWKAWKRGVWD